MKRRPWHHGQHPADVESEADDERAERSQEPYRIAEDPYRGICGGCGKPVSAFVGHDGGQEGSCIWRGGPWHPSCRARDRAA